MQLDFDAVVRVCCDRHGRIDYACVSIEGAELVDVERDSELWNRVQEEVDISLGTTEGGRIRSEAREHPSLSIGERQ